jgi:hypothetical protein
MDIVDQEARVRTGRSTGERPGQRAQTVASGKPGSPGYISLHQFPDLLLQLAIWG